MVEVRRAKLDDAADAAALVRIVDAYAREPGGQGAPLSDEVRAGLVRGLAAQPSAFALLAWLDGEPVGVAVCFFGYSTFAARPLVNVHDLAVLPEARGRGVGSRLLAEVERVARERGCCKLTLEVHDTNHGGKRLYARSGFGSFEAPTLFVTKRL